MKRKRKFEDIVLDSLLYWTRFSNTIRGERAMFARRATRLVLKFPSGISTVLRDQVNCVRKWMLWR